MDKNCWDQHSQNWLCLINPFVTTCQYTDTIFQLEIADLSIQIHDLTDDVLMYRHSVNTLTSRPSGHLVLK